MQKIKYRWMWICQISLLILSFLNISTTYAETTSSLNSTENTATAETSTVDNTSTTNTSTSNKATVSSASSPQSASKTALTPAESASATQAADSALVSKATNPLSPLSAVAFQNYVQTGVGNGNQVADTLNAKYIQHFTPNQWIPVSQLFRIQVPITVTPSSSGKVYTGLGTVSLFDAFILKQTGLQIGLGPAVTLPTTINSPYINGTNGPNEFLLGGSLITTYRKPGFLFSAVTQGQTSVMGTAGQPNYAFVSMQPTVTYTFYETWYLRSSATWQFNFQPNNNSYYIPLGIGLGKVWKASGLIFNAYVEPQPTVIHGGAGDPKFQLSAGLSILFNRGPGGGVAGG